MSTQEKIKALKEARNDAVDALSDRVVKDSTVLCADTQRFIRDCDRQILKLNKNGIGCHNLALRTGISLDV